MEDRVGKYCLNQKVWITEHDKTLEARVMRAEIDKAAFLYKIDYQGGMVYFENDLYPTKEEAANALIERYKEEIRYLKELIEVVKDGL